ncbi:TLDc domain [Phytophthora cactorum]|nr:TLDc domain [Phytophthora cactorum]
MGNNGSSAGARTGEWKGPFSDEVSYNRWVEMVVLVTDEVAVRVVEQEYECLTNRFKEMIAMAPTECGSESAGPEELTASCHRLGTAFYQLCLRTKEDGEAAGKLQVVNFTQGGDKAAISYAILKDLSQLISNRPVVGSGAMRSSVVAVDLSGVVPTVCINVQATSMTEQELSQLLFACLVMAEGGEVEDGDQMALVAKALARAAMPPSAGSTQASSDDFVRWIGAQFPLLYTIFMSWMARKCFESLTKPSYEAPQLSHKSGILSRSHFVALSTVTTSLQTPLSRLYTSAQDGLSFNRLSYHILGYSGSTLTIIRDTQGAVFGMFCDTEWKESSRYYGGNGCFLFRLAPEIAIYRGFALPRGLGMGGSTEKFRLFLSEDLDENSYTTAKCLSFEPGRLSSSEQFVIDAMEVWGCGGEESELSQKAHRQETADLINRARKVDKAQFVGNDFDKEMFLGKTFGHGTDKARVADDEH